ncbi:two-component system response regulator RstA [Erwinia sp. E_sp_B04_7]|uniref:two-component system response regulator RstA n=1 Tax=unclassified Erwinia TaxID=2622719 RepID=UPI0030CD1BB5
MNKIVFVEDDQDVGELIAAYLNRHDIEVIVESRGDRAEATIAACMPDLVMLDIMLPGKDGMTLCRDLRAGKSWSGPIVLLTSLDSDMNHILSLEMGANDYILKTTPPAVLLARLRLHLRQASGGQGEEIAPKVVGQNALRFGTLSIDPVNRQVTLGKEVIALSTADFDLLWELATHAGSILNRDALLKTLRGVSYDGMDRSIDVAISRLRKKLLDSATEPYRIKTIRNKGYLFAPHAWDAQ